MIDTGKIKSLLVGSLAALAMYLAPGCGHGYLRQFSVPVDRGYTCELSFSDDFKSDDVILYDAGEKVGTRKHSFDGLEHKVFYEFFDKGQKIGQYSNGLLSGGGKTLESFARLLNLYSAMGRCEVALEKKYNSMPK